MKHFPNVAALVSVGALSTSAHANPHPLPFSYPYETLPESKLEVEQYTDLVPVRVERDNAGMTDRVWGLGAVMTTEIEFGITDRLEAGFYFQFQQDATGGTPGLRFDGLKQRLRYRFAETGELPVDMGVYVEISELHDEIELEEKLLLSRRFGDVVAVANLWVEQEWNFQEHETELVYNPTVGASYEVSPRVQLGLEYWARGEIELEEESGAEEEGPVQFVGPTFLYQQGPMFLSVGLYGRLDKLGEGAALNDPYGKLWIRSIVGLEL